MYQALLSSIDLYAPIWARPPRIDARAAAEVAHLGTDDLRAMLEIAAATDAARIQLNAVTIGREELAAVIAWRVRRARLGAVVWLALWALGLAATVTAAAKGWYVGTQ